MTRRRNQARKRKGKNKSVRKGAPPVDDDTDDKRVPLPVDSDDSNAKRKSVPSNDDSSSDDDSDSDDPLDNHREIREAEIKAVGGGAQRGGKRVKMTAVEQNAKLMRWQHPLLKGIAATSIVQSINRHDGVGDDEEEKDDED